MSIMLLNLTQDIIDFQFIKFIYEGNKLIAEISRDINQFKCSNCDSSNVKATYIKDRIIHGLPMGTKDFYLCVKLHRIRCRSCHSFLTEKLDFIPSDKVHYTTNLAIEVLKLRDEMTIHATAKHLNMQWNTVKEIEKRHLEKKYKYVNLLGVEYIGIDETYIGDNGFITIVRDIQTGNVLHIGDGKGSDALSDFSRRIIKYNVEIKAVSMDFGRAYSKWAKEVIPEADIVYDHFHLIKLMNDKVDKIRRRTMNELEDEEKKKLKNKRWLFLKNVENLTEDSKKELQELKLLYEDLGVANMMKESLRNIYSIAEYEHEAEIAFEQWCKIALETGISYLKTMAKTITTNLKGILSFWKTRITNAHMEGFNNKIKWLVKQAYGYRDLKYFKLKIFDLPKKKNIKI